MKPTVRPPLANPPKTEVPSEPPTVHKDMDTSENSRTSLRRSLVQRRPTLTVRESNFLEKLIETGNEVEVQLAHENLLNNQLFFETVDDSFGTASDMDDGEAAFRVASVGSTRSSYTKSMTSLDQLIAEDVAKLDQDDNQSGWGGSSTDGLGSEIRKERLQQRRLSSMFGQIWQAHENGLSICPRSSRRSMMARGKSLKYLRISSQRADDIFRSRRRPTLSRARSASLVIPKIPKFKGRRGDNLPASNDDKLMDDAKSDNNKTRPRLPTSPSSQKNVRPALRRLASDASKKSVTFDVPVPAPRRFSERAVSEGAIRHVSDTLPPRPRPIDREASDLSRLSEQSYPSLHEAHPIRSESIRSVGSVTPSLHLAHSIRSEADASAAPSLHLAHPVRSCSVRSDGAESLFESSDELMNPLVSPVPPLIQHAHPIRSGSLATFDSATLEWLEGRDPSNIKDEKKDDDESKGIPEKVVIPTTGPPSSLKESTETLDSENNLFRPVLMRRASAGVDEGEGIEVADYDADLVKDTTSMRQIKHSDAWSLHASNSFDETMSYGRVSGIFRRRPTLERSMSDEDIRGLFLGESRNIFRDSFISQEIRVQQDDRSWQVDDEEDLDYYDSWMVIEDEYVNGYGGGGTLSFRILGTSAQDKSAMPHVLSPPLMESLQAFLPYGQMGESFWLKYSMVRDGASLHSFLRHARGSKHTILAIETTDGEVFGAFLDEPWRKNWNYYGSSRSFVWRMRHSRREKTHSIIDQAHMESEIDVFHSTGENKCFQLCTDDNIAVGGGAFDPLTSSRSLSSNPDVPIKDHEWGPSLMIQEDLLQGTSSPCFTFGSPSLSKVHSDGSLFEIINLELWTLTPCLTLEEAEKLELGRLFLERHTNR